MDYSKQESEQEMRHQEEKLREEEELKKKYKKGKKEILTEDLTERRSHLRVAQVRDTGSLKNKTKQKNMLLQEKKDYFDLICFLL